MDMDGIWEGMGDKKRGLGMGARELKVITHIIEKYP